MRTRLPRWLWKTLGAVVLVLVAVPVVGPLFDRGFQVNPLERVSLPGYVEPVYGATPCVINDTSVVASPALPSEVRNVVSSGAGMSYRLFWTGENEYRLLDDYIWPSGVNEVRLTVSFVRGHLDQDGFYAQTDSSHFTWSVTRPRDYRSSSSTGLGYCPNRELSDYPCYALNSCSRLGPNQVWVSIDPDNPINGVFRGVYDFSTGPVDVVVRRGENPILDFNNPSLPNGRRHRAEFRVVIVPIVP